MLKKVSTLTIAALLIFAMSDKYVLAQETRTTKSGYLASPSEQLLDKAIQYISVKDYVAVQKLLDTKMVIMLKGGLRVYVVDSKIFSGKIKIRPVGQTIEIWTVTEAVSN